MPETTAEKTTEPNKVEIDEAEAVPDCTNSEINTDGKKAYDWKSKYDDDARKEMRWEAVYIAFILIFSFLLLFFNWLGSFNTWLGLDHDKSTIFRYMVYFFAAGMLGGITFGMKYFYRVIARGFWTQDRRYWRVLSPWISAVIGFIVGCMCIAGLINSDKGISNAWSIAFGFFSGYFADEAVGKMYEIATAIFGKGSVHKG